MALYKACSLKTLTDRLICHWNHGEQGKSEMITPKLETRGVIYWTKYSSLHISWDLSVFLQSRGFIIRPATMYFCKLIQVDCLCERDRYGGERGWGIYYNACINYYYCYDDA